MLFRTPRNLKLWLECRNWKGKQSSKQVWCILVLVEMATTKLHAVNHVLGSKTALLIGAWLATPTQMGFDHGADWGAQLMQHFANAFHAAVVAQVHIVIQGVDMLLQNDLGNDESHA